MRANFSSVTSSAGFFKLIPALFARISRATPSFSIFAKRLFEWPAGPSVRRFSWLAGTFVLRRLVQDLDAVGEEVLIDQGSIRLRDEADAQLKIGGGGDI